MTARGRRADAIVVLGARLLFQRAGLVVVDAVAPPADWRADWPMWLREAVALPRSLWRARRRARRAGAMDPRV